MRIAQPDSQAGLNDEGDANIETIRSRVIAFRLSSGIEQLSASNIAYRSMIKQIDNSWNKLFADPIQVATNASTVTPHPQRTNNILEQFFRDLKRSNRKRSGYHGLSKTLKAMMAHTPLVKNLDNPLYMEIIFNGKATLEERFAAIDIVEIRKVFAQAQESTQRYPKRMAEVFKIRHLSKTLVDVSRKKAVNS